MTTTKLNSDPSFDEPHCAGAAGYDTAVGQDADAVVGELLRLLGDRPIILVGMMGAGKTTVGRRLARRLDRAFFDADKEIETAAGMTIPEIFDKHGEASFRDGERRVIARLLQTPKIVLATGGGAYMDQETRTAIGTKGVSVWLKADFAILMARVRRKSNRPLLRQKDPESVMRRLIDERYPIYAEADITVSSKNAPHNAVVSDIIFSLHHHVSKVD